jgi:hypothetical protein
MSGFRKTQVVPRIDNCLQVVVDVTDNDSDFESGGVILELGPGPVGEGAWVVLSPEHARRVAVVLTQAADAVGDDR